MISIPARIPIHIHPFFWLLTFFIGWINAGTGVGMLIWVPVIFISILIHEYGHALTALAFGQEAEISLIALGGLTSRKGENISKWQDFVVILNGPLAGFALCLLAFKIEPLINAEKHPLVAYAFNVCFYVNLFWNILNLLPILPLDGGQLMRVIFEGLFGIKGLKFSLLLSVGLGTIAGLILFLSQAIFAGAIFLMLAFESYRAWADLRHVTPQDSDHRLQDILKEAQNDLHEGRENEALSKFLFLRDQSTKGMIFVTATENIARLLAKQGHLQQAYDWLLPIEKQLIPDYKKFLQQLAFKLQNWEKALSIGTAIFRDHPDPEVAVINALICGITGKTKPAVGWLRSAIECGLSNPLEIARKREFDAIRDTKEFQQWFEIINK